MVFHSDNLSMAVWSLAKFCLLLAALLVEDHLAAFRADCLHIACPPVCEVDALAGRQD